MSRFKDSDSPLSKNRDKEQGSEMATRVQETSAEQGDSFVSQSILLKSLLSSKVRTLLIKGEPGTGKTTLALELLAGFGSGVYVSSRVSRDMLMEQNPQLRELTRRGLVSSVSMTETDEKPKNFKFEDYRLASIEDVLISILGRTKESKGELLIVLDSWDSIVNKLDAAERMKTEQSLLVIAEANNVKLIFVSEEERLTASDYFVDAVVRLEDDSMDGIRVRRLVWKKLRGTSIPRRSSLYTLEGGRVVIFDPTVVKYVGDFASKKFQSIPNSSGRFSSGSKDLDEFLGGGYRAGSNVLLEMDNRMGVNWHVPLVLSCEMNFLANGCAIFILPADNRPLQEMKENLLPYFSEQVLEKSLRVAQYNLGGTKDPCFVKLDASSLDETAERVKSAIREIKGEENRPCIFFMRMDSLRTSIGQEMMDPLGISLTETVGRNGDLAFYILKSGSGLLQDLNSSCDVHLKLEELDRTLIMHSLKPPSELYHIEYDYSVGYGQVRLRSIV
jgi:KaiC/GvpD/RAD55 family RecA-like ATPase